MKYDKRPCNATDCSNWINEPELCEKCLEDVFSIALDVIDFENGSQIKTIKNRKNIRSNRIKNITIIE